MPAISEDFGPNLDATSFTHCMACVTMRLASHSLRPAGRSLNLASFDVVARSTIDPLAASTAIEVIVVVPMSIPITKVIHRPPEYLGDNPRIQWGYLPRLTNLTMASPNPVPVCAKNQGLPK